MNNRLFFLLILSTTILISCQAALPPPPITAAVNEEFILRPGQSAAILGTDITLRLIAVPGDGRCPLDIECTESGPVMLHISLQKGDNRSSESLLQTFTDNDGRVPEGPFEGIQDRVEYEDYIVRVKAVLPYPANFSGRINDTDYQVSFVVTSK